MGRMQLQLFSRHSTNRNVEICINFYAKFEFFFYRKCVGKMIQFQYISDIHLETHDKHDTGSLSPQMFVKPSAPYLILSGDIGIPELKAYRAFLEWASPNWERIFILAGNHEYYTYRCKEKNDMATKKQLLQETCSSFPNVHFLDCSSYLFPEHNLRILGCTLWADTSSGDEMKIITYMNDARSILYSGDINLTPSRMTELHIQEKQWLANEIDAAAEREERVIVMTHYMPSYQLIDEKYKDNPLNMCFASDCEDLMKEPVKLWFCGHTHTGIQKTINGVKCLINPYGYQYERVETRNSTATFTLGD
jgi:hypothetical protein